MLYWKQHQHLRHYKSGKWIAVNPGWVNYKKRPTGPLNAYCVVGKHRFLLKKYKIEAKKGRRWAVGTCPIHKNKVIRIIGA